MNKAIILITLLLASYFCKAQREDTTYLSGISGFGTGISNDEGNVSITKWYDGRLEIHGDTLEVIKLLWERLEESNKNEMDLYDFVGKAVDFTNNVPDYWRTSKNNKAWTKYRAALIKLGFKIVEK